ncbi:MAG: crossover junction endodeoxyribonuclease RuvC [Candidatus Goldiibacteriota bacterium HGW-Goldbacteria-1]|jgi:crossover junction endodeoxyribonuclease RuvC|nr:MAG: crossover junction endodeoxyribonuclease RuvC [Candidatus Goldiibacteriota bacterium HGW-Goldbacteria-1]
MIILGIDPGTARCGYGVIEKKGSAVRAAAYGLIETDKDMEPALRLKKIYNELSDIIDKYKPEFVSVEKLFFNKNVTTAISVAEARGVILLSAVLAGAQIREYTPMQVKMALTGYGKADKKQMQEMIKMLLGLKAVPKPDDVADALAIAVCCSSFYKFENFKNTGGKK